MAETIKTPSGGSRGPFRVYAAGEMFDIHDLAVNVQLKEAVREASAGRYELMLPQSKEPRTMEHPNLAAHIRNLDLRNVLRADLVLARFDGLELDSGTVVEYMLAKFLGKPAVILREDSRRASPDRFDEPYNLMAKNWPRTVHLHGNSLTAYMGYLSVPESSGADLLTAEVEAARLGLAAVAEKIVEGLDAARMLPSPYPPEERKRVYYLARYAPGNGFAELLPEEEVAEILNGLIARGTL